MRFFDLASSEIWQLIRAIMMSFDQPNQSHQTNYDCLTSWSLTLPIEQSIGRVTTDSIASELPSWSAILPLSDVEKNETITMPQFDQSEEILSSKSQLNQSSSNGNGKGTPTGVQFHLAVDIEQHCKGERQWLFNLATQMRKAETSDALLRTTVTEVSQRLRVDRALIFRFQSENRGTVLVESMVGGYTPSQGEYLPVIAFGAENRSAYEQQEVIALNDINDRAVSPFQLQLLERFQVKASLSLPILIDGQLWGLLVVQQCSGSREWQEADISLLYQVVTELRLSLQPVELSNRWREQVKQEKVLAQILGTIPPSSDPNIALGNICHELRLFFKADRVVVYRFNPDWSGEFVAESVAEGWVSLLQDQKQNPNLTSPDLFSSRRCTVKQIGSVASPTTDTYLKQTQGGSYFKRKQVERVDDIYAAGFSQCYIETLEKYQTNAYIIAPIFDGEHLWGLFAVYQNSRPRRWQDSDVVLLSLVSDRLSNILKQLDITAQLQEKSEQLDIAVKGEHIASRFLDKILKSSDLNSVFQTATQEIRQQLKCDRVAVYRFNPDWSGEFVAEDVAHGWIPLVEPSIKKVWRDTYLEETEGGRYRHNETLAIDDIYKVGYDQCHIDLLEQFQAKAYVIVPILQGETLWGFLAAYQNNGPRHWQKMEVGILAQMGRQFGVGLQQTEYIEQLRAKSKQLLLAADLEKSAVRVINKIRQSRKLETIFKTTTIEIRKLLMADRVGLFRFDPDSDYNDGELVSEDVVNGYDGILGKKVHDHCFSQQYSQHYVEGRVHAVADIYNGDLGDCYIELLTQFQVRANLVVPLRKGTELWGFLCIHQCSKPRQWQEYEIDFAKQIALHFEVALQQTEYLAQVEAKSTQVAKIAGMERAVVGIINKIRQSRNLDTIFKTTAIEMRKLLQVDRVGVFKFYPNSGFDDGELVSEDVASGYHAMLGIKVNDHCFGEQYAPHYTEGRVQAVADVYNAGFSDCHIELLAQFQVRANLVVPLLLAPDLWGLLCIHQCSKPRQWQEYEIDFAKQIALHFGVALQQLSYLDQVEAKSHQLAQAAVRERVVASLSNHLSQSVDVYSIFQSITKELRQVLGADRVVIYRFNSDWSGEFVAESVAPGWISLITEQERDDRLKVDTTAYERCQVTALSVNSLSNVDTCLQETQGGEFARGDRFKKVDDIYAMGFAPCYINTLEQYQARAYLIMPIFQSDKLWGLLAAYQNTGPRQWQDTDVTLMLQISNSLGLALQRSHYLDQLRAQSTQLTKAAQIAQGVTKIVGKLFQSRDVNTIYRITTQEIRQLLKCDRVALYHFNPDWTGQFVAEAVATGWLAWVGADIKAFWPDTYLQDTQGGRYRNRESVAVDDIYTFGYSDGYLETLEQYEVKAYMLAPIFIQGTLWGLLGTYQNTGPRDWQEFELNALAQIAVQVGAALQQAEYLAQIQNQSQQLTDAAQREKADKEAVQREVMQLLSAVRPALEGDLTVRAPVTNNEVGTIADAYNNTLQSLRRIVTQVQQASRKVAQTSVDRESSIAKLTAQAQQQFMALGQALENIQTMVNSTEAVGESAQQVEVAVQTANQTLQAGDAAMNRTVDGILEIRETVAETSKRLKRLSESSQKVSRVVNLISNFTNQTQLLALNAAIEATRAGEYGRGFVVVADEVRSLARQSAEATTEIEQLVQEIQKSTAEVSTAMDKGIQQVAQGTAMVQDTRLTLNAIVEATSQISQLVEGITQATQVQTEEFQSVTQTMTEVAGIANKTSEDAMEISTSFQELLAMAQNLQASADQFKVE
ncbi:GAF domain-containing protein [Moorena sp. SIO3I6]|uniref:GAF domain-containing protein n=1 Tax=Moorena sp. SIO3I6 TaxID=2607831 RepID=UPI0025CD435F|nr:GAF domain-containing protein [Moorena sp. SIO3I6]